MRRVFEVDALRCPRCHASPMRILAAIHPPTAQAILKSMGLPTRAPPLAPAQTALEDWTLAEPFPASGSYITHPAAQRAWRGALDLQGTGALGSANRVRIPCVLGGGSRRIKARFGLTEAGKVDSPGRRITENVD